MSLDLNIPRHWWNVFLNDGKNIGNIIVESDYNLFTHDMIEKVIEIKKKDGFKNPILQNVSYLGFMSHNTFYQIKTEV